MRDPPAASAHQQLDGRRPADRPIAVFPLLALPLVYGLHAIMISSGELGAGGVLSQSP
jgi:hypothetical protein